MPDKKPEIPYQYGRLALCRACVIIYQFDSRAFRQAKCVRTPDGWEWQNITCPGCGGALHRTTSENKAPRVRLDDAIEAAAARRPEGGA
jgi:hypothetical protein